MIRKAYAIRIFSTLLVSFRVLSSSQNPFETRLFEADCAPNATSLHVERVRLCQDFAVAANVLCGWLLHSKTFFEEI